MPTHPLAAVGRVPVPEADGTAPTPVPTQATRQVVTTRDGISLSTDVYLPKLAETQPVPTVLTRLPYDKAGRYTFWDKLADRFMSRGFAVVVQDVRGKFGSDGEREPFVNEVADGADTLDWIVDQAWSNGNVGMFGDSYYGFTQWAAVSTKHPALKAIVPRVTSSDLFLNADPASMPSVAMREWLVHTWSHPYLSFDPYASSIPTPSYTMPEGHDHVLATMAELGAGAADGSLERRIFPDGWPAESLEIPALHMSGFYDNCLPGQLVEWQRATTSPAAAHQFLRLGSTDHEDFPWRELGTPLEDHETDDDAATLYLDRELEEPLSFLDHYLNERGGRWAAPTVRYGTTAGYEQVADQWPPAHARPVALTLDHFDTSLADRGRLTGLTDTAAAAGSESITWTHDPQSPAPYLADSEFSQCSELPDESFLHARTDIVVFDTVPVGRPVDLCGAVSFTGTIDAATATTHVVARLLDLYPTGEARVIAYGAVVADTSAGPAAVEVPMVETSYRVRPGHSLRLAISTACFPLYGVHPGHDGDPWDLSTTTAVDQTLTSTSAQPAQLRLSVR